MMRNKDDYAIAIRRPDGFIAMEVDFYKGIFGSAAIVTLIKKLPFIRGIFNFVDSLVLGMRSLNYSAMFYDDEGMEPTKFELAMNKLFKGKGDKVLMAVAMVISMLLAMGIFILLPFYLTDWLRSYIEHESWVVVLEGIIRVTIFLLYMVIISLLKDIRRLYAYHGAEHKCISCVERGRPLTLENAMRSSRFHRRCGTSFIFFVIFLSIIIFFFIRTDSIWLRAGLRIALVPFIAGISYEIIRLAGRSDNIFMWILSAPGLLIQRLTTKEPDEGMVEVAIRAVEAVFDWRAFLRVNFAYEAGDDEPTEDNEATGDDGPAGDDDHDLP